MRNYGGPDCSSVRENGVLNEKEFAERKIILASYPRSLFIQMDAPCNQDCLFCSRPDHYKFFDLDDYRRKFEDKLAPALERAERINLTGSGELLSLPDVKKNLEYFNRFPCSEKMFATNGSTLTPGLVDDIAASGNRYTIHVSLHSADEGHHRVMTRSETYGAVLRNLKYLAGVKEQVATLTVNLVFLLTAKNVDNFLAFIPFACGYSADGIIAYYHYVYRPDQKELSCYFVREKTNKALADAERYVRERKLDVRLLLPPRFGQPSGGPGEICAEAWSQIMINPEGDVISCDVAGDSHESLIHKDFGEIWNGPYYTGIRKKLAREGTRACSRYCFRANPGAVNDFRSHIITRGKSEEEIAAFVEGT